ncbi:MAG TPA: ATP-binding protein [Pyrinomonadaceae bacterium]|nr:ATP-binding protein [Pyrinomonadaceae bacterium]
MKLPNLFYTFRVRLLLVLAALLLATLGMQYYLNRLAEQRTARIIAEQEQALADSIALANESITSGEYLEDLDKRRPVSILKERAGRVMNILVVREDGRVEDSLRPKYKPKTLEDNTFFYFNISDVQLPKIVDAGQGAEGFKRLLPSQPTTSQPIAGETRAFTIALKTRDALNYIIVVLGSRATPGGSQRWGAARPLLPTLAVLLVATLVAAILVWRFTRPLKGLSDAAQRVAGGDFDFRVPDVNRRDEMGTLAANFNEMIGRLDRARELETRLNQAERSAVVGRLASAIAHEIRNPLNYINLTLDHLRETLAPEDPEKRALVGRLTSQLKTEVARINTRITEFLKYTRPAPLNLRPLDLRVSVADALSLVEVQAVESGIETRIEQDGPLPPVLGDAESLRSVFTNLIINGLQAIEGAESGRLTIRLAAHDGHARVEISDTGRGIAPESLPQIFEPYFSTKETGTGLGLAIVKKAIEEHGGQISVESTEGAGTTFKVELPTERRDEG